MDYKPSIYVVRYKQGLDTHKVRLGKFFDVSDADRAANRNYQTPQTEILEVRPQTAFENKLHATERFLIRSARILSAVAIGFVGYALLSQYSGIGDVPFSQLTVNALIASVFRFCLMVGGFFACWSLAFGEPPERDRL